jgi:hypothetical protein
VRSYLALKQGEVMQEIRANLARDGVVPTEADRDYLDVAIDSNRERVAQLRERQASIIMAHEQLADDELHRLYQDVEENHRSEQVASERRDDFLLRTTRHSALELAAANKAAVIDSSRALCSPPHHRAIDHRDAIAADKLSTTTFGKHVTLTGLLQPGCDGRELLAHETRGGLEDLTSTVTNI